MRFGHEMPSTLSHRPILSPYPSAWWDTWQYREITHEISLWACLGGASGSGQLGLEDLLTPVAPFPGSTIWIVHKGESEVSTVFMIGLPDCGCEVTSCFKRPPVWLPAKHAVRTPWPVNQNKPSALPKLLLSRYFITAAENITKTPTHH